ncbi:hypothetical protein OHB48_22060 [Streptomyces sp. NBC_00474]|nr:hypothetical protein [Streptomyces sp. NBC_00474]
MMMVRAECAPQVETQTMFRAQAIANLPNGRRVDLGGVEVASPLRAMRWLRKRAEHVADQLDVAFARPLLAWLGDERERHWTVEGLSRGEACLVRAHDEEGTLYVFTAAPIPVAAVR